MLRRAIEEKLEKKPILLMTHLVLGYPSFEVNRQVVAGMVEGGVDLIELQIPFSEPLADGPVISRACQDSIEAGARVSGCLAFAAEVAGRHDIPFLFMTYYNIIFRYGEDRFLDEAVKMGIRGLIVPDLPPEEGGAYLQKSREAGVAPIQIFAPTSTDRRMAELSAVADGFIYCVARRGVTGKQTDFDSTFDTYLGRCRAATDLPLAVGFGIREKKDVDALQGKADIAVIGTRTIEIVDKEGPAAVAPFIKSLR